MEQKIICKNKQEYYIDSLSNSIAKLNHKGERQTLTYNDISKMYLDFTQVSLSENDKKHIKEYLLTHPFTTLWFASYNKEKFPSNFTIEQIVDKLYSKDNKLLSTYATSILFLQTENQTYDNLMKGSDTLPEFIKEKVDTYNSLFRDFGMTEYINFPPMSYQEFLEKNKAVYRNSTSVEQTLKLLNIKADPNDELYNRTSNIWSSYLIGKNSQLSFKEAFPILNLTCTYSLYKITYKDKEFEKQVQEFIKTKTSNNSDYSTSSVVITNPHGKYLLNKILENKIKTNNSLQYRPHIGDYLLTKFNLNNYAKNPEAEKNKMTKWLMNFENSSNEAAYVVEVSEILKHNVDHSIRKVTYLAENYNKELQTKVVIPQELQPFCKAELSQNKQTPKIYEQIKENLADDKLNIKQKENLIKFFNILNKTAIRSFKETGKQLNLPEVFSRYFAIFSKYATDAGDSLKEVSEIFVNLINRKDELPSWILNEAFNKVAHNNDEDNYYGHRQNDSYYNLKDNIKQLNEIDNFLKKSDKQIYIDLYETNSRNFNIRYYYNELFINHTPISKIKFDSQLDYKIFKFVKSLKIKNSDPNSEEYFKEQFGKFLCEYTGLSNNIKQLREVKSIKNIRPEALGTLTSAAKDFQTSLDSLIQDKYQETKTINTYLTQLKTGLRGEKLQEELENHPIDLNHKNQVVYEDENYTCYIPTFDDVADWANKMHNCMKNLYLPHYKLGQGLFLYICKKGEYGTPLNATFLSRTSSGWSWGDDNYVAKTIDNNLRFNAQTEDKKHDNYGKPKRKLFEGLTCSQCYSNGRSMYSQPKIWELETHDHKYVLQTPKEREKLYAFCQELIKRTGFNGASWFKEFDDVMSQYYKNKKSVIIK